MKRIEKIEHKGVQNIILQHTYQIRKLPLQLQIDENLLSTILILLRALETEKMTATKS